MSGPAGFVPCIVHRDQNVAWYAVAVGADDAFAVFFREAAALRGRISTLVGQRCSRAGVSG
jgi:hypothetical protein